MTVLVLARTLPRSPWAPVLIPLALAVGVFAPIFPGLVREWSEFPNLSHGFAIPFIAGYLLWTRRGRLAGLAPEPSVWGLPLLVLGLAGLVVGIHGQESLVARLAFPVTLLGVVLFTAGWRVLGQTAFGILYLFFMIPPPFTTLKQITYRSRLFDAGVTAQMVGWLGVPVYQDGVMLHLPNIVLEVADLCSSIPAIAALLSLGVAYASVTPRPLLGRILIVAITLPVAIVSNIIRLIATVAGTYYIGPVVLQSLFHEFTGTVNFLLTFLLLLALDTTVPAVFRRYVRRTA